MTKICKHCGNAFTTTKSHQRYCTECKEEGYKAQRTKHRKEKYEQKKSYCKICGKPLENRKKKYCTDCLLKQYKYGKAGKERAGAQRLLYARSFDVKAIWQEIDARHI